MMDLREAKSGRSIGSSAQHRLMTVASSSHGQSNSSRLGRIGGFQPCFTRSTISVNSTQRMIS